MESYFFSEKQLFGFFHPAKSVVEKKIGIIMCYPLGQEYIRCHRLYKVLGNRLAMLGFNTFRFDFSCCGDSDGDFSDASVKSWLNDIEIAISEIIDAGVVDDICLFGVRFGATLALKCAEINKYVKKLVLMSPILDSIDYLKTMEDETMEWYQGSFARKMNSNINGLESLGFILPSALINEIKALEILKVRYKNQINCLLIDNENSKEYFNKANFNLTFSNITNDNFWIKKEDEESKNFIPIKELETIEEWLMKQ